MLKIVAIVLALIVAGILVAATMQPDSFAVSRTVTINAPAGKVYPHIVDFHAWSAWSPWEKLDPELKRTFSGENAGKGAIYAWEGNGQVGQGRMEIKDAQAPGKVVIALDFIKPIEGHNTATFLLEPKGDTTQLTWTMTGPSRFLTKVIGVFMSMDRMVGGDFEKGLAGLKAISETKPAA
ncbi:MAG: SRPBCC family protein [Usitatibacter sp.]